MHCFWLFSPDGAGGACVQASVHSGRRGSVGVFVIGELDGIGELYAVPICAVIYPACERQWQTSGGLETCRCCYDEVLATVSVM